MLSLSFIALLIIMIAPFDNIVFGEDGGERGNDEKHSVIANVHVLGAKDEQNQRANLFTSLNKLYQFEVEILQEFKNYKICSSAEGIDEKMDDNKEEVKSILCGPVKSLNKIFTNFTKKFEKGGELHNIPFQQLIWAKNRAMNNWDLLKIHVKKIEQKEWNKLKTVFPPFFTAIQKVIFMFMKKVREYSTKLISEPKVMELASIMDEEIKHKGEMELQQLFLSKMDELKETNKFQNVTEIAHGHHNMTEIEHGHYNATEIEHGHYNMTEIAHGHYNMTEIAHGQYNMTEIAHGHYNMTEIAHGHYNMTEIEHGHHNITEIAHGNHNITEIAHGNHNVTGIDHGQNITEIVYNIGLIAPAIHMSYKGMVEEVEFVLKVFVANSIFCGKIMKNEQLLHIVEG